ncbi:hypothetical protein PLESTB_000397300 [Pleodorina starrii]|uniref:Uncharacterized protein n=1 Tax=Pleodorina starrii TaxID=330485 RepID=A0A9W6EZS7_9CHLO|nr:hypothetical protein PLESTB_000397300 [Pleodorina starrii]GLC73168.1 hypothetical protein PLESTF_001342700 [Pleodorina starrii]
MLLQQQQQQRQRLLYGLKPLRLLAHNKRRIKHPESMGRATHGSLGDSGAEPPSDGPRPDPDPNSMGRPTKGGCREGKGGGRAGVQATPAFVPFIGRTLHRYSQHQDHQHHHQAITNNI